MAFREMRDGELFHDVFDQIPFPGPRREAKESITLKHQDDDPETLVWTHDVPDMRGFVPDMRGQATIRFDTINHE